MKRSSPVLATAFIVLLASSCSTPESTTSTPTPAASSAPASPESVKQAVRQLENERIQALLKGDAAFIERVYADDYSVVGANGIIRNKSQVVDELKAGGIKVESIKNDDLETRVYGDTVILTGHTTQTVRDRGQTSSGQVLFTRVYVKRNNGWQLASQHMSSVPPPPK
jgi:ketosteroid isomerase-like protein